MPRALAALLLLFCASCATQPGGVETTREIVLKYVAHDVGTVGPFAKHATREPALLAAEHKAQVLALLDRGAVGFLIIEPNPATPNHVVMVLKDKIVGDFPTTSKEAN